MMKPYYQDNHATQYCQDFRKNDLPEQSVQMVCTSPPYWGLRKYSGEQDLIWGDNQCEHKWASIKPPRMTTPGDRPGPNSVIASRRTVNENRPGTISNICSLCGAWKGAYGLEPTPEMYVQHTTEILREIRRVLRKDGVVFWNIGDSYGSGFSTSDNKYKAMSGSEPNQKFSTGVKPKDLCLIPFRVAIAAQEDGWWVRSVIIWSKPNPMPESVTDRPTESHEYILMLTKSKNYYWDADAVREKNTDPLRTNFVSGTRTHGKNEDRNDNDLGERSKDFIANGRNIRTVWEFPTQPYPEAHFAVFPEKLPEICIKAATPEVGCCSKCGAPWERITEGAPVATQPFRSKRYTNQGYAPDNSRHQGQEWFKPSDGIKTLGWQPTCKCNADKTQSIVLDPFMGSGTVLWVARKLGRKAIGFDTSEEYCKLAVERCRQQVLL